MTEFIHRKNSSLGVLALIVAAVAGVPKRPNILLIRSDDHAHQAISAYGSTLLRTPNIDRIANEPELVFERLMVGK